MFDNINVVGGPLVLSSPEEVDGAETQLSIRFPAGYREYVTRFGEGILGGCYIRVYPPRRILSGLNDWRQRIDDYWHWEDGCDVLTSEQALHSVIIGDTPDGDELIVHPDNPERIFILPRNSEDIHVAGDGLPAAIEWLCSSGVLTEAFPERNFEPFDSRPVISPARPPIIERDAARAAYSSIFSSIHDDVDETGADPEKAKLALFEFMSAMKEWENKFVALTEQSGWEAHGDRAEAELRLI